MTTERWLLDVVQIFVVHGLLIAKERLMWLNKTVPAGLLLCLIQFGPVAAQTPPSVPPLYSRGEVDSKIEAIQNEINTLKAVDPYSKADIDAKLAQIKAIQSWGPLGISILAALLAAFALWRSSSNKADRALAAKNRDDDVTLVPKNRDNDVTPAAKPAKRSSVAYGWFR